MISYNEAINLIFSNINIKPDIISVDIENSVGFILAEDIFSDIDFPPFDNSAMDGYATIFSENVKEWEIIGEITAGNYKDYQLASNHAVSVMTGAKMPSNADTVIPIEHVTVVGNKLILKENIKIRKEQNLRKQGEDLLNNSISLKKFTRIGVQHIPVLASCGKRTVLVLKPLNVGVLATGDELVDISIKPQNDKIRSSNLYTLTSLVKSNLMNPVNFGICKDDYNEIKSKFTEFLFSDCEILLTSGGISVGNHDFLKSVLEDTGVKTIFWKVNIKPGKPVYFGKINFRDGEKYVIALPGNPASCFVCFKLFVEPLINSVYSFYPQNTIKCVINENLRKKDGKLHFVLSSYKWNETSYRFEAVSSGSQSSGSLITTANSNCLILFDEDKRELKKGDLVTCMII